MLRSKFNDKRDDYNFPIVNTPFFCNNIPATPYLYALNWGLTTEYRRLQLIQGVIPVHFGCFKSVLMNCFIATRCLSDRWFRICFRCRNFFSYLPFFLISFTTFTELSLMHWIPRSVPYVEQELPIFPVHLSSPRLRSVCGFFL